MIKSNIFALTCFRLKKDIRKTWGYILIIALIYYSIASQVIGYDTGGISKTLILYFMGADRMNIIFFQWLFIQTSVAAYCIYVIRYEITNTMIYTLMKMKKLSSYFLYLTMRVVIYNIFYYSMIYCAVLSLINVSKNNLNHINVYSDFIKVGTNINIYMLFGNYILSSIVFIIFVCIFGIIFGDISRGYLMVIICEIFFIFIVKMNKPFLKFLPLTQGVFTLLDQDSYTYQFAFFYQVILFAGALFILENLFKRKLEKFL